MMLCRQRIEYSTLHEKVDHAWIMPQCFAEGGNPSASYRSRRRARLEGAMVGVGI